MKKMSSLTVKISSKVKSDLKEFCNRTNTEIDIFVRDAIARAFVIDRVCLTLNSIRKYGKDAKAGKKGTKMDMLVFEEHDRNHGEITFTSYKKFREEIGLTKKKR
ncbi:MAG: hypothetical protein WC933_01945 [Candidatus Paceibacterota bacterium]|jgi:predicted transcriptional regulator